MHFKNLTWNLSIWLIETFERVKQNFLLKTFPIGLEQIYLELIEMDLQLSQIRITLTAELEPLRNMIFPWLYW